LKANYADDTGFQEDDPDNLDTEIIFSEFKEAIARLAVSGFPEEISLHEKLEKFIADTLVPNARTIHYISTERRRPKK